MEMIMQTCGLGPEAITHLSDLIEASGEGDEFGHYPPSDAWNFYQAELIRLTPCSSDAESRTRALDFVQDENKGFAVSVRS